MKTVEIKVRKIAADSDHILVSKNTIELQALNPEMESIVVPESYGKEIYLASDAKESDFEEISLSEFKLIEDKLEQFRIAQEEYARAQEEQEEEANDSN